ncbi:MAG: hypothetical protein ACXWAT_00010 [Methylobacter sp.]
MDDENAFTHDGITYISEEAEECHGCNFELNGCVYASHPCVPAKRADGRSIIWIKKDD